MHPNLLDNNVLPSTKELHVTTNTLGEISILVHLCQGSIKKVPGTTS